jgi:hypothetical protein
MRGLFVVVIVLVVAWYVDHSMYGGRYFMAFSGMFSQVVHQAR